MIRKRLTPTTYERLYLRLLKLSPFQQRSGGWRFGTRRMADSVIERLIASGRARVAGEQLVRHDGAESAAAS